MENYQTTTPHRPNPTREQENDMQNYTSEEEASETRDWIDKRKEQLKVKCEEKAREVGDLARSKASQKLSHFKQACEAANEKLKENGEPQAAEILKSAADQLDQKVREINEASPDEIINRLSSRVRSNPLLAIAGTFLTGFVISRYLNSAAEVVNKSYDTNDNNSSSPTSSTATEFAEVPHTQNA